MFFLNTELRFDKPNMNTFVNSVSPAVCFDSSRSAIDIQVIKLDDCILTVDHALSVKHSIRAYYSSWFAFMPGVRLSVHRPRESLWAKERIAVRRVPS